MKVILNKDLSPLGEEGDVKDVAKGYARNFLFPRGIALPYNEKTIKLFEGRREEIESRKSQKRTDAAGLKERLESLNLEITMPAGANGKLYGAVTSQTIMDELTKNNFQIERKRIEIPGVSIKNVGKYKVTIRLYESASAEITVSIMGHEVKSESKSSGPARPARRHRDFSERTPREDSGEKPVAEKPTEGSENPVQEETKAVSETPANSVEPVEATTETAEPAETSGVVPAGDSQ